MSSTFILGGGVTGLSAGIASQMPVYEACDVPGGICSSYYVRPGETTRLHAVPEDEEAYRFEIGGGHWIFGGDPAVLRLVRATAEVNEHARRSGVWFADRKQYVPYPLQNHLRFLGEEKAARALQEMAASRGGPYRTMEEWLYGCFGPTLCGEFFIPFHELYTAGLHKQIAPQDAYKSPVDLSVAIRGAFSDAAPPVGYNTKYLYPRAGLNVLAQGLARRCDIRYGKRAVEIDVGSREVRFADGTVEPYESLICTLPLNHTLRLAAVAVDEPAAPYTSTLVLNVGGRKGPALPQDHWLYHPRSEAGFHRVGIYSNVDAAFVPRSRRSDDSHASFYVERAYLGGERPTDEQVQQYAHDVVAELKSWGFLDEAEAVDPTWIDVAYTWSAPGSRWKADAVRALQDRGIYMVGRYARWVFQGIADSIRDGLLVGASFRRD